MGFPETDHYEKDLPLQLHERYASCLHVRLMYSPCTPLLYSKTWVYKAILFFPYFCSKTLYIACGYSLEPPH